MTDTRSGARAARADARDGGDRLAAMIVWPLFALIVVLLWARPIASSFWLDETGTYWVVKDGLRETIERAATYHGQSPLYYSLVWLVRTTFGNAEWILRLPSLLSLLGAALLVRRIGIRAFGRRSGGDGALIAFASIPPVAFAAGDARPYALGLLFLSIATLLVLQWADEARGWRLALAAVFAALAFYVHYLFALAFVGHAIFVLRRWRALPPRRRREVLAAAVALGLALVPAVPQLRALAGRSSQLSIVEVATIPQVLEVLAPSFLLGAAFIGLAIARFYTPLSLREDRTRPGVVALFAAILAFPPVALLLVTTFTTAGVFGDRYYLSAFMGAGLLAGGAVARLAPRRARVAVLVAVAVLASISFSYPNHQLDNWRAAIAAINSADLEEDAPVLMASGFVESATIAWLRDPQHSSYLNAPVARYPVEGDPIAMPFEFDDPEARAYVEALVEERLLEHDRFVFVTRRRHVPIRAWLEARLLAEGYTTRTLYEAGSLEVTLFARAR